jgi:hypothetical protein
MVYGNRLSIGIVLLILLFPAFCLSQDKDQADCRIQEGPCTKVAGSRTVTLDIRPKPVRPMAELDFTVTVTPAGSLPGKLILELTMPGMYMGGNRVELQRSGTDRYTGRGALVRCRSGRKLWKATLLTPDGLNPSFTFNVAD